VVSTVTLTKPVENASQILVEIIKYYKQMVNAATVVSINSQMINKKNASGNNVPKMKYIS
jgi:hypothetical protein